MKTQFLLSTLLATSMLLMESCHKLSGEGPQATETRDTGPFTGIESDLSGSVELYPGTPFSVTISAQQNILDVLETRVTAGTLHLYLKHNVKLAAHQPIRILIHVPEITAVAVNGSGTVKIMDTLTTASLALSVAGSGNLYTDTLTVTDRLSVTLSGSGSVSMPYLKATAGNFTLGGSGKISSAAGSLGDLDIAISGSGAVDLSDVISRNAVVRASGSGETRIGDVQTLDVHLSGSGNVYYSGTPEVTTQISGSGKIKHL